MRLNTWTLLTLGLLAGLVEQACATGSAIETGRYLTAAAGCYSCHTDTENEGEPFAGGHRLETEYGVFVVPNITPDADTGIGGWTDDEFIAAVKHGERPGGGYYYPAFPYASYAGATDADILAIKAYLDSLPPVSHTVGEHELLWWIPPSGLMGIWQTLFTPWEYPELPADAPAELERGAYLVRYLGHCGECHSPRDSFGAIVTSRELSGMAEQEGRDGAPDITATESGIGDWSADDLELFLDFGMYPDGDFAGSGMAAVIDHNTSRLTPADRQAMAAFLGNVGSQTGN